MSDLRRSPPPPVPQPAAQSELSSGAQELEYRLALWSTELRRNPQLGRHIAASELPQLLQDCQGALQPQAKPLLRTVHHFACTGGTLISKCLGAMPGAWLLSEVDPLSPMPKLFQFAPTDLISLLRSSSYAPDPALLSEVFLGGLEILARQARGLGRDLILRGHPHSHFCQPGEIPERPTLPEILQPQYELRNLVTVRHPLDSFLSMAVYKNWVLFEPKTLEEYCRRYLVFLDRYAGCEILRYEQLTAAPEPWMQQACKHLELRYNEDFQMLFSAISLSGDSGRSDGVIGLRPRREVPDETRAQVAASPCYEQLCARLGYIPDPDREMAWG